MAERSNGHRGITRRQFMKAVPMGIAGVLAVSVISVRLVGSLFRRYRSAPQPPEDSIFAPARERYNRT